MFKPLANSLLFVLLVLTCLSASSAPNQAEWVYTVRPGDTVQSIADRYLAQAGEWPSLLRYNNISQTSELSPGTLIKIPVRLLKTYPKPAKLLVSQGSVWVRKAHSTPYVPALRGSRLTVGDELKTDAGFALIKFADGSTLKVADNSIIIFNTLTHYGETGMVDTRFRLMRGGIKTDVTPRKGPAARYEVSTPSAVAAVRGTAFRMRVRPGQTITEVTEGRVSVRNATTQISLNVGQGAAIGDTGAISTIALLPAPEMEIPETVTGMPFQLEWEPLAGADHYLVELYQTTLESQPLLAQPIDTPNLLLPDLANGSYILLVRGIDQNGIEGLDIQLDFNVEQAAQPAELLRPLSGAEVKSPRPEFSWQLAQPILLSSLEISRYPDFRNLYTRTPFAQTQTGTGEKNLSAGEYYWRVVTMAGGDQFAYSESRPLIVRDTLEPTRVIAVNYLQDQAKVFWKSVVNAETYLIQLAEDELFQHLIREDEKATTSATLRLEQNKTYWVRVKGIGNDFYSSDFGEPQILKIHP